MLPGIEVEVATGRDGYHHGDLHRALIEGALELVTEQGIDRLSLREVARRVGVSHTAPYRHFSDKEALLAAVAAAGFRSLTSCLQRESADPTTGPLKKLQAIGVAYVRFAIGHPAHYRVMFGAFQVARGVYPELDEASRVAFAPLVEAIVSGQKAESVREGDPIRLAWTAWSLVHGLATLHIDGKLPLSSEEEIAAAATFATWTLIEGLGRSAVQQPP